VGELSTRPVAIGQVMQVANVSKPFLRKRFGGLLGPAELEFKEFWIEMTSISASLPFLSVRRSGLLPYESCERRGIRVSV
jgi:hypothetical protein